MKVIMRKLIGRGTSTAVLALAALALWQPAQVRAQWTTGTNINNTNTGNVGVGTSTPGAKLDVGAGVASRGNYTDLLIGAGSNSPQIEFYGATRSAAIQYDEPLGGLVFYTNAPSWTQALFLANGGNVGLGTTSPANMLHVNNASGGGFLRVSGSGLGAVNFQDNGAPQDRKLYQWRSEGGLFRMSLANDGNTALVRQNILVADWGGNVGIGTAAPSTRLVVSAAPLAEVRVDKGGLDVTPTLTALSSPGSYTTGTAIGITAGQIANALLVSDNANFYVVKDTKANFVNNTLGNGTVLMTVTPAGRVGIGADRTSPAAALDVSGDIRASGSINATYQDVAEWVPSTQKLAAGTVVVLDKSETNHVLASTKSYDTKVAGVVSAEPGVILGVGGEGKLKVATTGRVRVKVDATRSPIEVGDLLVTSDAEGVAMKSLEVDLGGVKIHRPGTIIGKALEPLASGTGEILVLLSLQ